VAERESPGGTETMVGAAGSRHRGRASASFRGRTAPQRRGNDGGGWWTAARSRARWQREAPLESATATATRNHNGNGDGNHNGSHGGNGAGKHDGSGHRSGRIGRLSRWSRPRPTGQGPRG